MRHELTPINSEAKEYLIASGFDARPGEHPGYIHFRKGDLWLTVGLGAIVLQCWFDGDDDRKGHWATVSEHKIGTQAWNLLDWAMFLHVIGCQNLKTNFQQVKQTV